MRSHCVGDARRLAAPGSQRQADHPRRQTHRRVAPQGHPRRLLRAADPWHEPRPARDRMQPQRLVPRRRDQGVSALHRQPAGSLPERVSPVDAVAALGAARARCQVRDVSTQEDLRGALKGRDFRHTSSLRTEEQNEMMNRYSHASTGGRRHPGERRAHPRRPERGLREVPRGAEACGCTPRREGDRALARLDRQALFASRHEQRSHHAVAPRAARLPAGDQGQQRRGPAHDQGPLRAPHGRGAAHDPRPGA